MHGPSEPSVPFLKPTGVDRPDAISRCVWASAVRAPIAVHATRSPMYWGVRVSRASVAAGRPIVAIFSRKFRAILSPSSMRKVSFRYGSFIRPFHPVVVRGFSK